MYIFCFPTVPDQPGRLVFVVTSLTSLNVSWAMPQQPNGVIAQFDLSYYQESLVDGNWLTNPCKTN